MDSPAPGAAPVAPAVVKRKKSSSSKPRSGKRAKQNLAKAAAIHRERTGHTVAATSAASNTSRAIARGIAAAQAAIEVAAQAKSDASASKSRADAAEGHLNLARDLVSERSAQLEREKGQRLKAEREKAAAEMKQRAAEARNLELSKELQGLRSSQKKLHCENAKVCQAAGMVLHRNETLFEAEEGSTRNLEEEV